MQDCSMYGGQIVLGDQAGSTINPSGSVEWANNLFEDTFIMLQPNFNAPANAPFVDLPFYAYNNLFKRGVLALHPFTTSQGYWQLKNNLFDREDFSQDSDSSQPLDYNYNGWWTNSGGDNLLLGSLAGQLTTAQTDDGSTNGSNDQILTSPPPYQSGPFGNYYMAPGTVLQTNGSTTADQLCLYHYTTATNQTVQGNAIVDIGLHYLAASNSANGWVPLDTDGDGIPDYVENWHGDGNYSIHTDSETDWLNPMTDGINWDAYNALYDDVDLAGDGLTGTADRILGANPLVSGNPFALTPLITGQEPFILTYSIPLTNNVNVSNCMLALLDNGQPASTDEFDQQPNGTYLVQWNTTFASNGPHFLSVEMNMLGSAAELNSSEPQHVLSVLGPARIESVNNLIHFDPDTITFGSQMWIYGTLPVQSADYEIDIYATNDTTDNPLQIITGHTDSNTVDEVWDLTVNQQVRDDDEFYTEIWITPTGAATANSGSSSFSSSAIPDALPPNGPVPVYRFKKGSCGDYFTLGLGFGWMGDPNLNANNLMSMVEGDVENIVFNPGLDNTYNNTTLNGWDRDPFYIWSDTQKQQILQDIGNPCVGNFFWYGHGSAISFGPSQEDADQLPTIAYWDVGAATGNIIDRNRHGPAKRPHPFRFVILDACECGDANYLADAFGIEPGSHASWWYRKAGFAPQAMVAWTGDVMDPQPMYWEDVEIYGSHLAVLYNLWMSGAPLVYCVYSGAQSSGATDIPLSVNWKVFGYSYLTREPQ